MFSTESNASKFAFISYVKQLEQEGIVLIDCQIYTEHLESLGAHMIPREDFKDSLRVPLTFIAIHFFNVFDNFFHVRIISRWIVGLL